MYRRGGKGRGGVTNKGCIGGEGRGGEGREGEGVTNKGCIGLDPEILTAGSYDAVL